MDATAPDDTEPLIRFDDDPVAAVAQLVPRYGYEEAERIVETAVRTHRRLDSLVPTGDRRPAG